MKTITSNLLLVAICLLLCSFKQTPDSILLSQYNEASQEIVRTDTLYGITGNVSFNECHATLTVPNGFMFLDKESTQRLFVDYWGNLDEDNESELGCLVPDNAQFFYQVEVAYLISYNNCGYIKDEDANSVDYDELLETMQESEKERNSKLPEENRLYTKYWEFAPKYLADSHVLVWAKRIADTEGYESVNYDMRVLGKDGLVSLMAVLSPDDSQEVKAKEMDIINSLKFDKGYAYSDFDASRDRVSDWTIGGLVAGGILAKSGLLAKLGVLLLKGWKLIVLAVAGLGGVLFKKKKKKDEE